MKKHLKKLRPLLLLMALFMLTNCSEELDVVMKNPEQQSVSGKKHTILYGKQALEKRAALISNLKKDGGQGLTNLNKKINGNTTIMKTRMEDIEGLIDHSEVYAVDQGNGVVHYTYMLNHPDTSEGKFFNIIQKTYGTLEKVIMVTYSMDENFISDYNLSGDFTKFTGTIDFKLVTYDEGFPCDEEPEIQIPVSGGSGPGGGGGTPGPGSSGPGTGNGNPYNQALVDAKMLALKISVSPEDPTSGPDPEEEDDEKWEKVHRSPRPGIYMSTGFDLEDPSNPCGDEEETGILEPPSHEDICNTLKALLADPAIKNSLNSLKGSLNQNNERLVAFNKNGSGETYATPEVGNSGNNAVMKKTIATYGVAHTHQNGTAISPSGIYKMFSMADLRRVYEFAKGYGGSGPTAAPLFFNMMVVDGYTYIVFPDNVAQFKNLGSIFEDDSMVNRLDSRLNGLYNKLGEANSIGDETLAETFLQFINNALNKPDIPNLKMSMYRIKNDNNFNGDWEKLELNLMTTIILKNLNPVLKLTNMKYIYLLLCVILAYNCKAQSPIISVQEGDYSIVGAYYKDIDNLFPKFVGTWKYTNGNESFTIKLKKLTSYYDALGGNYIDALIGEYKYVDTNGIEQVNTLSNLLTDISPYENNIIGTIIKDKDSPPSLKRLQFIFVDPERKNLKQFIVIKYFAAEGGTPEKIELTWIGDSSYVTDDTSPTDIRVPKINYTLIKQ